MVSVTVKEPSGGIKGDGGKEDWSLVEWPLLTEMTKVLTFGAQKYERANWKKVSRTRYEAALMRHWVAYLSGEIVDPETGLAHLAHVNCCLMFLHWMDNHK